MWNAAFQTLWRMNLTASAVILLVLAARLMLYRAPAIYRYLLWAAVLFRLLCPVGLASALSVFNIVETPAIAGVQVLPNEKTDGGIPSHLHAAAAEKMLRSEMPADISVWPSQETDVPEEAERSAEQTEKTVDWSALLTGAWIGGTVMMLLAGGMSLLRLHRALVGSVRLRRGILLADGIDTAFVLGIFRPRICVPSGLSAQERELVIWHEHCHMCRGDHILRPVAWLALCIHWYNPLVWLAFYLSGTDMERSCDEAVIRRMNEESRTAYSAALLRCAVGGVRRAVIPPAFGESGVRTRILGVLHYKKPARWVCVAAAALCILLTACTLTDPMPEKMSTGVNIADPVAPDPADGQTDATMPEANPVKVQPEEPPTVPVLDSVLAQQNIQSILATLRITEEHGISFGIPYLPPKAEVGTALFLTLNATYRLEDGTVRVHSFLDNASGWESGDAMAFGAKDEGELIRIMLRAAYRTPLGENSWQEMAASYVEISAPFDYNKAPILEEPSIGIEYKDGESLLCVNLQNGGRARLALTLPDGFVLAENWEKSADPGMPPAVTVLWQGGAVGTLRLYPFAMSDAETVQPAKNELPMQIFAATALSNHAEYEDYAVAQSTDTGAAATCKYSWQELTGVYQSADAAAAVPWKNADCILAYDWSVLSCYVELVVEEGLLTAEQLEETARSIRWQKTE